MGTRTSFGVGMALTLGVAYAAPAQWSLEDLLTIGLSHPHFDLKWGVTEEEVQRAHPDWVEVPSRFDEFKLEGTLIEQGCTFHVFVGAAKGADQLSWLRLEYVAGEVQACIGRVRSIVNRIYGSPSAAVRNDRHKSDDGTAPEVLAQASWDTPTSCVHLTAKESAGYVRSPLTVSFGDEQKQCGYVDQVVPVGPRKSRR